MVVDQVWEGRLTRRDFMRVAALGSAGFLAGCAVNPVTGEQQLMLVSERDEVAIDRFNSPHQFSADYGPVQDAALNRYISRTGKDIAMHTHRPDMPYSFRAVNATYANAYAFPGGSIGVTRGILLDLENEAELAGLLGHELGHVNARHTAQQMSKGMMANLVVGGASAILAPDGGALGSLISGIGGMGAGALLARYSRDNERQADALGMEYMYKSGYNPGGMVGLMDVLKSMNKRKPGALDLMFATHPMSEERYRTAVRENETRYRGAKKFPVFRERYMDHTARLRSMEKAIDAMQKGDKAMAKRRYGEAEAQYGKALRMAPRDYAGLMMMAKCQLVQKRYGEAQRYAGRAKQVYPKEAQAYHLNGISKIMTRNYGSAYDEFDRYGKILPGNPNTIFFKGFSMEGMGRRKGAANEYYRYLQAVSGGDQAQYAYKRLVQWGYIKK